MPTKGISISLRIAENTKASTSMSVGHCMLWWYEQLSQWSVGGTCSQECLAGRGRVALARDGCVGEVVADQALPHLLSHPNSHIQTLRLFRLHLTPERNGAQCHTTTTYRNVGQTFRCAGVQGWVQKISRFKPTYHNSGS